MPRAKITALVPELHEAWDQFVASHAEAGVYHTLAWQRVTEEGLGHKSRALCALDELGQICGILPLFEVRGIFGRRLVSLPMRDRGGPVAEDDATAQALVEHAANIATEERWRYLEIKRAEPMPDTWQADRNWVQHGAWITTRLDLQPGVDALWSALSKKSRRWPVNKARREGVEIVEGADDDALRAFYALFLGTRRDLGVPPYGFRFFQAIQRHLLAAGHGRLILAMHEGQPVHGLIEFFSKESVLSAYAAPLRAARSLHANELIWWSSIEHAAQQGYRTYDFGADSEQQENLLWFKQSWGGEPHPMAYQYFLPEGGEPPSFDNSGARFDWIRRVWGYVPLPLTRLVGHFVTRQAS